ncbi:glycosyltransferase [Zunongwangia sp. SCSIO 43204]|uniref:glycosyltransferase n=1 Tax=Zunongwangia sp. SCSIO 43204 TaxID=2779359 RepID=UPI001CA82740|nr:glycosyltransferase [Zunongwangia sp. SCSIO 43204]UAB84051.1 glycosyltransferase [Zunongwangia sp. SCSIO 43204]
MTEDKVYILHKNGADSHYTGLQYLVEMHEKSIGYREFSIVTNLVKAVKQLDFQLFNKQIINLFFLINLLFSKNKKVVLGIPPFDKKLIFLLKILKNHRLFYHTSWTCWDKSFHPKKHEDKKGVMKAWIFFLEKRVEYIFTVTKETSRQIHANFKVKDDRLIVVAHSLTKDFKSNYNNEKENNSFIYLGRLVPQKGIKQMLSCFSKKPSAKLTIIGEGCDQVIVEDFSKRFNNIEYIPYMSDKKALSKIMARHQYLILNSQKTEKWEELFSLIIIEGMSLGLIPISSDHTGPKEIITEKTGYLFEEGNIQEALEFVLTRDYNPDMAKNAIEQSTQYYPEKIAERWKPILT